MTRTSQLLRGLATLAATASLVAGIPAGLIRFVGWPLPARIPSLDQIQLALRSGIDPQFLIKTLAVIVWVAWAQLVVALGIEVGAAAKGRTARRGPVLPAIQVAAARLVATITLAAATLSPLRPDAALAHHPLAAVTVQAVAPDVTQPSLGQPADPPAVGEQDTDEPPEYVVRRFDTLWGIAETTLGDGRRWQEIRDLNLGRPMFTGKTINTGTDHVPAGTSLLLPATASLPTTPALGDIEEQATHREVTVEPGDHFWKIAEKTLRDAWGRQPTSAETASYWRQLIDANRDQLLPPHDPDLIFPGQVFQLPPIPDPRAGDPTRATEEVADSTESKVTVEQGDHFWRIAEKTLGDAWDRHPTSAETADYWHQLIDANHDRLLPPHDPNLIYPGQVFRLPAVPQDPTVTDPDRDAQTERPPARSDIDEQPETAPEPSLEPETSPPEAAAPAPEVTEPATTAEQPQPTQTPTETTLPASDPDDPTDSDVDETGLLPTAARVAGLGVLAAGVIALINRLRRTQIRQRRPNTIPTPPPAEAVRVEATLRAVAAPTATELIDLALRALAHQVTQTDIPPPQVVGVHLDPDTLRILLWSPHNEPPEGWQVDDDGRSWTLPASIDPTPLRLHADGTPAPYPAMVTVGHTDHGQLLMDLEHIGAVQITGTPDDVAATCYTMAIELAASPIADTLQVVCVGFGHDLAHLERIRAVEDLSDISGDILQKQQAIADQDVTPMQGRLAPWGGDRWDPLIILDPRANPPPDANMLLAAAHAGKAVCAVVGYPTGDRWRFQVTGDTVRIDPLSHTVKRRNLTPTEQEAVSDLIAAAKNTDGQPAPDPLEVGFPTSPDKEYTGESASASIDAENEVPTETTAKGEPAAGDAGGMSRLQVRVLGTIRVDGLTKDFPQLKCPELVTYLALHRHGVEADTLMEALWPEQAPDYDRLNRTTSRARTTLGEAPNGELYLPHVTGGLYRVSPQLGCDLEDFQHHVTAADRAEPTEAASHLQTALDLVDGPPFTGAGNAYTWGHAEGLITHAIVAVDNAAHRLARHALQAGDPHLASWAARKGLAATAVCEECYRNLMRAAVATDDQTALDAIYNELTAVVDADQGPDATSILHPDTVELYERNRRHRKRNAG